jgi:hypothetical protein
LLLFLWRIVSMLFICNFIVANFGVIKITRHLQTFGGSCWSVHVLWWSLSHNFKLRWGVFGICDPSLGLILSLGIVTFPFFTSIVSEVRKRYNDEELEQLKNTFQANDDWIYICANCGKQGDKEYVLKFCARYKVFSYCSQECQVKHRKAGHKVDCKGHHWIESYFPKIRTSQQYNVRAQLHKYNPWKE